MTAYKDMTKEELSGVKEELERQFQEVKAKGLSLICPGESHPQSSWIFPWG